VRTGVTEVTVNRAPTLSGGGLVARLGPLRLAASKQMRLERLYRGAVYKEAIGELQLPVPPGEEPAAFVAEALRQLVPPPEAAA
jgi:hypothetical protein